MTYTIKRNGHQYGPYSCEDVRRYLSHGSLSPTDFVWSEEAQRWMTLSELHLLPPPIPSMASGRGRVTPSLDEPTQSRTVAPTRGINKVALVCVIAIWLGWFLLPFLTVGWGPIQLANSTLWDCLDLASNGLIKFLGLLAITAPVLGLLIRSRLAKCLYLMPVLYLGAVALLGMAVFSEVTQTVSAATKDSPILGAIAQGGLEVAIQASSFDYGAYVLLFASLILGVQVFARR